jgi:galactose-1-phosphate uridylyltransferase, family 1
MLNLADDPHRRLNVLTGEWVLVSPRRTQRPWQGQTEQPAFDTPTANDPTCYMCPGNVRAEGKTNPYYEQTFCFDNDFSALLPSTPQGRFEKSGLLVAESERGICRVICFSPRHDLTLALMELAGIRQVVDAWIGQISELSSHDFVRYVQIFENRGAMMGASNPHPHGQIWATSLVPNEVVKEDLALSQYQSSHQCCLLCRYLELELELGIRTVCENESFAVVVPFWALWPFETLLLCKRHVSSMDKLSDRERNDLAEILKRTTTRYDNLFEVSFPYSMGFHQSPTDVTKCAHWHFHGHFYPPLLRSATIRKFMVGYEMLGSPQRDITAESAAARLKQLSEVHYRKRA